MAQVWVSENILELVLWSHPVGHRDGTQGDKPGSPYTNYLTVQHSGFYSPDTMSPHLVIHASKISNWEVTAW